MDRVEVYLNKYLEQRFKGIEEKQDSALSALSRVQGEFLELRKEVKEEAKGIKFWLVATIISLFAITVAVVWAALQVVAQIVTALASKP